ncbi:hypothetical protein MXMO3_03096 [Maritalea myrionectae]|uniref:SnoaL-like domain-containing protein n=2 Tax=Maritalea myrionectae TaxID=454601 RepID=A0A2R4MHW6_9HYPH|nr:hypothetical protein MXMO3_03096 [Maritalea myrionectae]
MPKFSKKQWITDYLAALSKMAVGDTLSVFLHPQIEQVEFPNALTKQKTTRDLAAMLQGAEAGRKVLQGQSFEIVNYMEDDQNGALAEVIWTGKLAVPIGSLQPGDEMKAHFAWVFEFKEQKIFRQRNYDCFEPF